MEPAITNLIQHEKVQQVLQSVPSQFRRFSPEDLRGFFMTGQLESYQAGDVIMVEGSSEIQSAWLIADGSLSIWKEDVEIAHLTAGDFTGEEFLFTKGARIASVKADSDVMLIRFDKDSVIDFFRTRPERLFKIFIMNLLEIQQRRIKAMNSKVARLQKKLIEINSGTVS
jgi:CRP-like cAMP-binding protein